MKPVNFLLAALIMTSMPASQAGTIPDSKNIALIQQACQMGRDDAEKGRIMYSSGVSLKNANGKYSELEARIRNEYEKCYSDYNSVVADTPVSTIESKHSDSKSSTITTEKPTIPMVDSGEYSNNQLDDLEVKLPPHTSDAPFTWFYDWVAVVEETPDRYSTGKKRAANLRSEFIRSCQKVYSVGQNDDALIKRWCTVTGWKEFTLKRSALRDETFKKQLEQMKQQIRFSEESYRKFADRDVNNAFDRTKAVSLNYTMQNIEETKVLPYFSGISVALANIKATKIAMKNLDPQVVAERRKVYLDEIEMREKKRLEEEKKRLQRKKHERYLIQKSQADNLTEVACNKGKEDSENLKKLQPDQFESQAIMLDMIDGLDKLIIARYTECYDTQLLSLTCKKAGADYMQCRYDGAPFQYASLASKNKATEVFQARYKKCYKQRKELYKKENIERNKAKKNILKYSEIYMERGGYFINDYNECVASLISAANNITNILQFLGLSNGDVRSCENLSSLLEESAMQSCSCNYGVVIDTLNENIFTEFSDDIFALIKFSHSKIDNNKNSQYDGKGFKGPLVHPDEAIELFRKIGSACAI